MSVATRQPERLPAIVLATIILSVAWICYLWIQPVTRAQQLRPVPDVRFTAANPATDPVPCPPRGVTVDGVVTRVIDGDTVVVRSQIEYQVRLIDCWAPESRTKNLPEKQRGLQAKSRMNELAQDKHVRVHMPGSDALADSLTLGRVLGRVWLMQDGQPAETDLSAVMVREQLATRVKQSPTTDSPSEP